jgi:hypothetical protein
MGGLGRHHRTVRRGHDQSIAALGVLTGCGLLRAGTRTAAPPASPVLGLLLRTKTADLDQAQLMQNSLPSGSAITAK